MPKHSHEKIENAEFDLQQMKKEYLWSRDWKSDGSYPGGLVLWHHPEKGYKGCGLDMAYTLESNQEQWDEAYPPNSEDKCAGGIVGCGGGDTRTSDHK